MGHDASSRRYPKSAWLPTGCDGCAALIVETRETEDAGALATRGAPRFRLSHLTPGGIRYSIASGSAALNLAVDLPALLSQKLQFFQFLSSLSQISLHTHVQESLTSGMLEVCKHPNSPS